MQLVLCYRQACLERLLTVNQWTTIILIMLEETVSVYVSCSVSSKIYFLTVESKIVCKNGKRAQTFLSHLDRKVCVHISFLFSYRKRCSVRPRVIPISLSPSCVTRKKMASLFTVTLVQGSTNVKKEVSLIYSGHALSYISTKLS